MKILLDTVTISTLRDSTRCPDEVLAWSKDSRHFQYYLSATTLHEISYGILKIAHRDPRFADVLRAWYSSLLTQPQNLPLLDIDPAIAKVAASFRYDHKMSYNDSFIGATAEVHGLTLATRNVADFQDCGIPMINPWAFGSDEFHHPSRS